MAEFKTFNRGDLLYNRYKIIDDNTTGLCRFLAEDLFDSDNRVEIYGYIPLPVKGFSASGLEQFTQTITRLSHGFLHEPRHVFTDDGRIYLVYDRVSRNKNLSETMECLKPVTETEVKKIFTMILFAVQYILAQGLSGAGLSPENIYFHQDRGIDIVLPCLGRGTDFISDDLKNLGVILWEMCTCLYMPEDEVPHLDDQSLPPWCSDDLIELFEMLKQPGGNPTMDDVLSSTCIANFLQSPEGEEILDKILSSQSTVPSHEYDDDDDVVPHVIRQRGPEAVAIYMNALTDGYVSDRRALIMLVGQEGVGKTSVRNSLLGIKFNPKERKTESVERQLDVVMTRCENPWKIDRNLSRGDATGYEDRVARMIWRELSPSSSSTSNESSQSHIVDAKQDDESDTKEDSAPFQPPPYASSSPIASQDSIPKGIQKKISDLEVNGAFLDNDEDIKPTIVDFAGQELFYTTHPVFLNESAVYIVVDNITGEQHEASWSRDEGTCHHLDYIHFWMSAIHSFTEWSNKSDPNVVIVLTHADQPRKRNLWHLFQSFHDKPYRGQVEDIFNIDNTQSGTENEGQELHKLRATLKKLCSQLPSVQVRVPVKWYRLEDLVITEAANSKHFITTDELRGKLQDTYTDEEFETALNFLNDRGIILYFPKCPEVKKYVFLDHKWLVDVFKAIVTLPEFRRKRKDIQDSILQQLECKGILEPSLISTTLKNVLSSKEADLDEEQTEALQQMILKLMEEFSLLCKWITPEGACLYLVPSALEAPPGKDVLPRTDPSEQLYLSFTMGFVPLGLFPRLIILLLNRFMISWATNQPVLRRKFASIFLGDYSDYKLIIECDDLRIIKIAIKQNDAHASSPERCVYKDTLQFLKDVLKQLKASYSWLKSMEFSLQVQQSLVTEGDLVTIFSSDSDENQPDGGDLENKWLQALIRTQPQKEEECVSHDDNTKVSQEDLRDLSEHIEPPHWKKLLVKLDMRYPEIEGINHDVRPNKVREKVYKGLIKISKRGNLTVGSLRSTLEEMELKNVAESFQDIFIKNREEASDKPTAEVDRSIFYKIAERVAVEWKWLLRHLKMAEHIIENIGINHEKDGVEECCTKALEYWKEQMGNSATVGKLSTALCSIGEDVLAGEL